MTRVFDDCKTYVSGRGVSGLLGDCKTYGSGHGAAGGLVTIKHMVVDILWVECLVTVKHMVGDMECLESLVTVKYVNGNGVAEVFGDYNEEEDSKSSKSKSSMTVTEVKIPSYATSAIIGTNRSSLQRLQNSCNVQIDLKQDGDTSSTEDQTLCIRGSLEATQQIELRIQQIISDISTVASEDMYIPSSSTISLIGNNYQTVRYINRVSGAKVLIDTTENRDPKHMQLVSIEGSREQIEHAKKLINDVVDKNLTFHEEPLSQCSSSDTAAHLMHRVAHTKNAAARDSGEHTVPLSHLTKDAPTDLLELMVVSVTSPGHFWAHIRNENLPKLVNLQKNIDEFYSDSKHFQTYQCQEVAVDDIVAVCLSNQSQWYRARVTAVLSNSYKVFCVDYGYNEEVPKDNVCRLREDYLSLPYQAVECYLANIKPKDDPDWTRSACNAFENMVCMNQSKIISGEIVRYQPTSHGLVPCLQLIDYDGPQDSFIALKPDLDSSRFGIQNGQDFYEESKFLFNPSKKSALNTGLVEFNLKQSVVTIYNLYGNITFHLNYYKSLIALQVTWCNLWLRAYTKRAAAKTTNINEELVKMGHAEWNKSSSRRDTVGKDERCTISQEVLNSEGFGSTESLTDPFLKSPPTEETPISLPPANTGWADDFPWAWAYNEEESAPGKDVCEMQTRLSNIHSPTVEIRQPGAGDITSLQETNALTKKTSETSDLAEHSEDKDGNTASKAEEVSNGFFYNGICSDVDAGLVKATSDLNVDHVTNNDSLVESPSANENSKLKYLDRREEICPSSDYDTSEMFDSGLMSGDLSISTPISETSHEFDHESLDQSDLEYVAHSQSDVTRVEKPESGSGGALDLGVTQVSEDNYSTDICESSITVSRDDVSSGLDSLQGDQIRFSQEMSSLVIKDGSLLDQATLQATNTKESDPLSFQESSVSPILKQPLKIQSLDGEETEDYELEHTGEKLNSLGAKDVVSRRDTNVQKYEELKSSEKLIPVEADTNISLLDSDRTQKTTQEIVTSGEAAEASLQSTGKPEETKTSDTVDAQFSRSDLVTNVSSHTETSRDESELNNFEYISVDQKTDMKMTDTTSSILVNQSDNIPQWTNLEDKTYQVSSNLDDTQTLQPHQYITEILYDICPVTKMTSISKDIMTSKAGLTQPETKTSSEPENNRLPSHSEEVTLNVSTGFDGRSSPIDQTVQPHSDSVTSNLDTEYNEVWTKFYSPLEEDNDWNEKPCLTLKEPSKDNNDTMTYLLKDDSTQSEPLENEIEQEDIWKMFYNPISNKDWEEKALKITRDNEIWRKFYETDENTDDYKSLIDRNQYSTDWKYTVSEPLEEDRKDHYIWSRFYSSEDSFKGVGDTKTSERRKDPQVTKVESDSQIGDKITSGVVECSSQGTQELLGIHHSEVNNITTQVLMDGDDSQDPESSGKTVHSVDREINTNKSHEIFKNENVLDPSKNGNKDAVTDEKNLEYSALEEDNDCEEKDPSKLQVVEYHQLPVQTFLESWKDTASDPLEDADILTRNAEIPNYDTIDDGKNINTVIYSNIPDISTPTSENVIREVGVSKVMSVQIDNLEYSALEEDNDWDEKGPTLFQVKHPDEKPVETFLESWTDTVSDPLEDADILSTEDHTPDDGKTKDQNVSTKSIDVKKLESISTSENIVHESVGDDVTSVRIEPSDYNLEYSALEEDNDWKEKDPTLVQVRTKVEEPAKTFLESWKDTVSDPLEDADILSTEDHTPDDGKTKDQNVSTKSIDVKKLESISTSENIVHESVGVDVTSVTIEPSDDNLEYSALEEDNDWKEKDPTLVQVRTKVEEPAKTFLESWKDTVSDPLEDADILSTEDQTPYDVKPKDQNIDTKGIDVKKLESISTSENIVHKSVGEDVTSVTIEPSDYNLEYSALEEDNDWKEKDPTLVQVRTKVEEPAKTFLESWKDTVSDPLEDADILSSEDQISGDVKPKDQDADLPSASHHKDVTDSSEEKTTHEETDVWSMFYTPMTPREDDNNLKYSVLEEDNDWEEKDATLVQVTSEVEEPIQTFLESWKDTASDPLEDADILSTEEQIPDDVKTKQQNIDTKGIDVKKLESIFMSENIVHESVGDDVTSVRIEPSDDNLEYSALEEDNDWKEKDPTLVQVRPKVEEPAKTFLESWKDTVSDPLEDADILSTDDSDNFMQSRHAEVVAKSSTFPIKRNWDSDDNIYVSVDDIENELGITEVTRKLPSISHHKIVTESSDILLGSSNSGGKHQAPSRDIEENRKESNSEKGEISDDKTSAENNISGRHFDLSLLSDSMLQDKTLISQNISFTDEYSIDRRESFLIPDTNFRTIERSSKSISEDFMKPHGFFQSDTTSESKSIDHIDDSPSKPEGSLIKDTDIKKMTCDTIQLDEEPSGKADEIKTLEEESDEKGDDYDDQDDDDIWLTMLSTSPENGEMEEYDKNEEVMSDNDDSSTDKETSSHYEYQDSNAIDTQTSVFEKTSVHQTTEDGKLFSEKEIVEREHQDLCHKQTTEDSEYSDKEDAEFVDAEEELKMEFVDAEDGSETEENTSYTKVDYSALEEDNGLKEKDPTLAQERPEDEEPAETSLQSCEDIVSGHLKDVDILRTEDHQISGDLNTKGQDFETKAFGRLTSENVGRERFDDHDVTSVKIEPSDDNLEYSALEEDNDWEEKDPTLVQVRTKVEEPVQTFLESWKDTASDPLEDADILSTEEQIPDDVKTKQQNIDTKGIDVKKLESIFMSENIVHESVGDDVTTFRIEPSDDNLEYSALEEDNDWKEKDPTLVQVRPKVEEPAKTFLESWKDTVSDPLEDADILSIDDSDNNVIHSRHTEVVAKSSTVSCTKQWDSDDNIYVSVNDIEKELGIPDKTRDLPSASHYKDVTDSSEEKATHDETDVWSMFYTPMTPREDDNNLEYSALEEDNDWEEKDATLVQVTSEVEEPIQTFLESWKDTASDPLEDADILSTEDQIPDDGKPKDQGLDTKNITTKKLECISTSESIVRESVGDDVTSLRIEPSDYNLEYSALEEDNDWKEKDPTLVQVRTKVEEPAKTFLESWKDTVSDPLEDADILSTEDQTPDDVKPKDQNVDTKVIATKKLECLSTSESIVRESVGDDVTSVRIEPSDYNLEYSALEEDNDWKEKDPTLVQVRPKVEEPAKTFLESWKDTVSDPLEDADILSTEDHTPDDGKTKDQNVDTKVIATKKLECLSTSESIVRESVGDDVTSVRIEPSDYNLEYSALEEDNDKEEKDLTLVQVRTKVEEPVQTFLESGKDAVSDPLEDADILRTDDSDNVIQSRDIEVIPMSSTVPCNDKCDIGDDIYVSVDDIENELGIIEGTMDLPSASHHNEATDSSEAKTTSDENDVWSMFYTPVTPGEEDDNLEYSALDADNDWEEKDPTLVQVRTKVEEPAKTFLESWQDNVSDPLEDADILSTEEQIFDDIKPKDQNVDTKNIATKKVECISTSENIVQVSVGDDVTTFRIEPSDDNLQYSALEEDNDWEEKDPTLVQVRTKVEEPAKTFLESWQDTVSDPLEDADILSTEDQISGDVETKEFSTSGGKEHRMKHLALEEVSDCEDNVPMDSSVEHHEILEYDSISDSENEENYSPPLQFSADNDCHLTQLNHGFAGKKSLVTKAVNTDDNEVWNMYFTSHQKDSEYAEIEKYPLEDVESVKLRLNSRMDDFSKGSLHSEPSSRETSTSPLSFEQLKETASDIDYSIDHREDFNWELREQIASNLSLQDKSYCYRDQPEFFSGSLDSWASSTGTMFTATPGYLSSTCLSDNENTPLMSNSDDEYLDAKDIFFEDEPHVKVDIPYTHDTQSEVNESITLFLPTDEETTKTLNKAEQEKAEALQRKHIIEEEISLLLSEIVAMASEGTKRTEKANLSEQDVKAEGTKISQKITEIIQGMVHSNENMEGKVAKDINAIIPQDANLTEVQDTMRSTEVMDNQETYSDELVVPSETETKYVNLEVTEQMEQKLQNVASLYSNYAEDIPDTQLMLKLETLYFIEKMGKNKDKDNLDTQGNLQSSKFVTSIESTCDKNIKHQDNQHVDNFKSSEFSELSTDQHQETDQSTEVQSKSSANENEEIFANVLMVELPITEELHVSDEHLDSSESSINRTKDSENCRFTSTLELQLPNTGVSDTTKLQNQRSSAKKDGLTSRSKRSKSKLSPGDRIARRWRKKSPHRNYSNALFINVPNYSESSEEEMSKDVEESQLDNEECKMALKHHRLSESGFPIETHSELLKRLSSMESDCSSTSSYEGFRCTLHTFVPDYDMKNYHNIFVIPKRYGTFSTEVNMNIAEPKETNLLDESSPSKKTVKSSVTLANSPEEVLCTIAKSPSEHTTTSDNFESKRKESVEEETTIIVKNTDEEKLSDKSNDRRDSVVIDFTADERRNDRMSYFTEEQIQDMLQKVNQKGSVTQYSKSGYQTDCYSFIKENEFRYGTSNYPSLMNYPSQAEPYWQTKSSDPEKTMLLTYSEMLLSSDIISSKAENAHEIADNDSNIINDDTEKPTDVLDSTDMEKLRRESQELTQTSEQLAIDLSSLLSVDSSEISDELSQNYVTKRPKSPEDHSESSQETSSSDSDGDYPSNQHLILEFGGEIDVSNKCTKLPSANISSDETNLQTQSDDVSMKSEDVISETDKTALTEANLSEEIIATVPDSADGKPVHVDNFPEHSEYLSSQATEEISEENSIIEIVEDHTEGPNDKMFDDVSEFVDRKEVFFGTMRQQIDKPLLSYSLPVNTSLAESSSSLHDGADCETSKETVSSDVDIFQMKLLNRELCETNELNAIQHEELNEPQAKELDNVSVLESVGKEFEFTSASSFEESSVSIPENSLAEKSVPVKDHSEEEIMPVTFDEVKSNFTEETSTKKPEDISNAEFSETDIGKFSPGSNEVELELQKPPENILQLSEQFYKECFGNESSYVMTEFPEELRSREEYSVILTDKHLATFDENQRQETDICRNYSTEKDQFLKETDADAKSTGIKSKKKKKQKKKPRFFALDNEMLMQFVETTAELSKESEFDSSGVDQNDSAVTKSQMEIQSLAELETEESLKELPPTSLAAEDKFEISEDTLKTESKINSVTEEPRLSHDADFVDAITEQESSTELLDPEFTPNVIKENAKIEEIEQTVNKLVVSPCKEMFTHETEISSIECKVSEITSEPLNDNTINIKYSDEVGFDLASVQQPEAFVNVADTEPYCQLLKEQTDIGVIEHSSVDQLEKKEEQSKNVDLVKHVEISDVQETFTESSNVNLTAEWDNATQLEIEHRSCLLKTEESPDQLEIKESTCLLKTTEDTALSKTEESTTQTEIKDSSPAQMESEIFSKSSPEKIELKTDITEVEQKQLEVKCGESTVTASPTFPVQSTVTAGDVSINAPEEEKPKKKRKKRRSPYLYGYGDDSVNSSDFIEPVISDPDVSQHILPALAETVSSCTDTTALKSTESKSSPETITDKDIDATPNENQVKEATPEIKDPVSTREPMDVTCTKCSPEEETDKDIHPKKKKKKKKKSSLKDENEATSEQKKSNQSSKKDKESFSKEKTPDTLCKDGALDQKYKSLAANSSNIKSQEGDDQIPLVKELKDSEATKSQDDYPKTDRQLSSEEELQKEFVVESNEERTDECVYSLLPSETEIDVTTHQASMLEDVKGEMIVENIHKTAQKENKPCSLVQAKVEQLSRSEEGNNLAFAQEKTHSSAIVKEDLDESYLELELSRKSVLDKQVSKSISSPPEGTGSDKHLLFSEDFKDADFRLAEKSDKKSFVSISESNENVQSEIFDETNIVDKDNESSGTSNTKIASLESKKKRRSPFPYGDDEKSILSKGIEEFFQSTHSKATETGPLYVDTPAMTSELNVAKTPDLTISNQSFSISEELKHSQVMTIPGDTKKKKKQKKTSQVKFCESGKVIPVPPESSSVETSAKISVVEDKNTVEIKKDVSKTENKVSQTLSKVSSAISKKAQSVLEDSPIRKKKSSTSNEESSEDSKTNENNSSILKLSKKKTKHKEVSAKENSSELCPSKESKNLSTDSSSITSSEHSQKKFIAETEKLVKLEPVEEKTTLMSIAPPISKIPSETDSKCPNKENKEKEESSTGKVAKSVVDKISSLVTSITKQVTDSLEELSTHKKKKLKQSSLTIPELKETEDKRSFKERTESSNSESKNKSNKKVLDSSLSEKSMRKVGEANPNSKQKSQKGNSSSKASPLLSKKKQKSKHSRDSKNIPVSLIKIESPYRQHTYLPLIQHLTEEEAAFSDTTPLTKRKKRQRKKKKHHNMSQLSTTTESSCEIDTALWLHSNKSSRDNSSHQRTKIPPRPKIVVSEDTSAPPLPLPRANSTTPPTKRAGTPTSPYLSADSFNNPRSRSRCRRSPVKELLWLSEQEMLSDRNDSDSTRRGRSLNNINRISKINLAYISTGTRVRKRRKKNIIAVS
eukprot:XP_014780372.1 PREDICTED: uncharacterized protein LOC106876374 [Octopus bimaculoides]